MLEAAQLFAGKNRYHTDLWTRVLDGHEHIGPFLSVVYWSTREELHQVVVDRLYRVLPAAAASPAAALNELFGLYESGVVPRFDPANA